MNKKAEMGIGTLIIFIAMILVAAIAASVLIQTATSLQNRALLTGTRTQEQIGTAIQVLQVYGEDGTTGTPASLEDFFMKFKLAPGSEPIRLNDTLLEFDTRSSSVALSYNSSASGTCNSSDFGLNSDGRTGNYSAMYLIKGTEWKDGYLQRGDVVELCFKSPASVVANEDVAIRIIPRVGIPSTTETAVPEIVGQKRIYIFP